MQVSLRRWAGRCRLVAMHLHNYIHTLYVYTHCPIFTGVYTWCTLKLYMMYTQVMHLLDTSPTPADKKKKQNTGCRIINTIAYGGDSRFTIFMRIGLKSEKWTIPSTYYFLNQINICFSLLLCFSLIVILLLVICIVINDICPQLIYNLI